MALKQRHPTITVGLNFFGMAGHQHAHESFRRFIPGLTFNDHFINIAAVKITNRAFDQAGFLVHQGRRLRDKRIFAHLVPKAQQILIITLDFSFGPFAAGSAHNHSHFGRNLKLTDNRF